MDNRVTAGTRETVIEADGVKKKFRSYRDRASTLKERILQPSRRKHDDVMVLRGTSFRVYRGEAVGIIGKNGCGKSTILKLLARILRPDEGQVRIRGRVSSLIELGAGFHPDMTGRENIYTNASIFGLTKKEVDRRLNDIIRFSELEDSIDSPVRTYSSGMYMRLAFAVAINVDADVLLIDEILAVGDSAFQKKCFEKLREIKANGTTIVIVSHSMDQMYRICDRLVWIEDGLVREEGIPKMVGEEYMAAMEGRRLDRMEAEKRQKEEEIKREGADRKAAGEKETAEDTAAAGENPAGMELPAFCRRGAHHVGNGMVRLTDAYILDAAGRKTSVAGIRQKFEVVYHYRSGSAGTKLNFVISLTKDNGVYCFGTGSISGGNRENAFLSEGEGTVKISFETNNLQEGTYLIDLGIQGLDGTVFHYIYSALEIRIEGDPEKAQAGIVNMSRRWTGNGRVIHQEY